MNKKVLLIAALALALIAGVGSFLLFSKPQVISGAPALTDARMNELLQEKCMSCHTRDFDLPFYARVPGIKGIIEKDYADGLRAFDLRDDFGEEALNVPVSEVALAKMEWVMLNDTMPPAKFTAVHWSSKVNSEEKSGVLAWVAENRARHYATGSAAARRANEPVQPIPESLPVNPQKAALGGKLFHDKRLSGDNTVACATCHDLELAGTDNARFSEGVRKQVGDVNAPTVFNAAFNFRQFWDGRAATLHEQVAGPPFNPIEMDSKDWGEIMDKLERDQEFSREFAAVYPDGWTPENIQNAISEYEMTLITPGSAFDKWLLGDDDAIGAAEREGYQRFKDYRCASCHVGKSLGGQSYEYMDLKKDYFADRGGAPLGSDAGHMNFSKRPEHEHKFKVPNLRNIELTGPYLHDGTVATLDEAVRIMGTYLSGIDIPQGDRDKIVAFLRTLTGEYQGKKLKGTVTPK